MGEISKEKIQWLHDAATEFASTGMKMTMNPDEVLQLTTPLLALRERAEPIAYIFKDPVGKLFWTLTDESNKDHADVMPVYAAPPAPVAAGWIPCSERMPPIIADTCIEYLVYESLNNRVQHDYWNVPEDKERFQAFWNHYGDYVTHWMPLPAAPSDTRG